MNPNKAGLRRSLRQARLALPFEERQAKSTTIMSRLWQVIDWSNVTTAHCFEPILRLGEVNISDFITNLQAEYPSIHFFTSRKIDSSWQIVSLTGYKPAATPSFDVIIVPMLGFDTDLHRIGYGGGFYDKFLNTQPRAKKIGVCFEIGKNEQIPAEPHDISLDIIVTESRTY